MRISLANLSGSGWREKVTMFSSFQISHWRTGSRGSSGFSRQKLPSRPVAQNRGAQEAEPFPPLPGAGHRLPAQPRRDPGGVPQTKK